MPRATTVTVLIPTWNAGTQLTHILDAIRRQRVDRAVEILIIDSGSTDGTLELVRSRPEGIRLLQIPHANFNHGLTRDMGITEAHGEIVVLLAQDAMPADDQWLQALVDGFEYPEVAGTYSRQLPRPDASPFLRNRLLRWMPENEGARIQFIAPGADMATLAPSEQLAHVRFDNVSAAVRRSVALQTPFGAARFGEDLDWARRVLLAGYKIIYQPRSQVFHSHDYSTWYEMRRAYLDHQNRTRLFGSHRMTIRQLFKRSINDTLYFIKVVAGESGLGFGKRMKWWAKALPFAASQNLGVYLGERSVSRVEKRSLFYRGIDRLLGHGV